ncbi:MAG TPA: twin-arginine translocase subunit TatC [Acidimicrobiales bacterium]|jgi:sec-independent protein translocase protein TatC|nr:twin-arginine translocase subunit TatC [Acidimicrobiales bacterium]
MALHAPWSRAERPDRSDPEDMTLVEHLKELRRRLVICILAGLAGGIVAFAAYTPVLGVLMHPYCASLPPGHACNLYVTGPLQGFSIRVKIAVYGGIFLASPIILWQLWRFITPGLNPNEKRYAVPFIVSSFVLFTAGATTAYLVANKALHFLAAVGGPSLKQIYTPTSYVSLVVLLMVAFGLAYELPVVLICLELAGVLSPARLAAWRRWAIVIIFALAAIFIPSSDPFSLFAMAIPMCLFYELAIIVGKVLKR